MITILDYVFYWQSQISIYMIWETSDCKVQDQWIHSFNTMCGLVMLNPWIYLDSLNCKQMTIENLDPI